MSNFQSKCHPIKYKKNFPFILVIEIKASQVFEIKIILRNMLIIYSGYFCFGKNTKFLY